MKKKNFKLLCLIFSLIIIFSAFQIIFNMYQKYAAQKVYNNIEEEVVTPKEDYPQIDFKELKKINDKINSWIFIKALNISYPVVQGDNNEYYLNHLIDGKYNKIGSIYLDYRNDINLLDKHSIIYGHYTGENNMFTNLSKYDNQKFYDENPSYYIIQEDKIYEVKIIASYFANVKEDAWKLEFNSNDDFYLWVNWLETKSLIKTDYLPKEEDRIISLSTCSAADKNDRFLLVGVLVEKVQD